MEIEGCIQNAEASEEILVDTDETEGIKGDDKTENDRRTSAVTEDSTEAKMDYSENEKSVQNDSERNVERMSVADLEGKFDFSAVIAKYTSSNESNKVYLPISRWDFNKIVFPNFGISSDSVKLAKPDMKFTPGGFEVISKEYSFLKSEHVNKKKEKRKGREQKSRLRFSRPDVMEQLSEIKQSCKSWSEFKVRRREIEQRERTAVVPCLYSEELQPLVDPLRASSTGRLSFQEP